ncbi:effector-associated constant component EACC1 [Actinokineospora inagensis]|uniref:effector-associated constant component EACC1 n=1 Tax=Actinokineospora inagensis TaxID=103730 RepID=UPI0003F4C449|nr:hypothetical protein [Actinokineospora inagensis]
MSDPTLTAAISGDDDELRTLARWLRDEDDLRGHVHLVNHPIHPGHMGGALDAVAVALSSGGTLTVLVKSLFTYLSTRRKEVVLKLRLKDAQGREFEAEATSTTTATTLLTQAEKFFAD